MESHKATDEPISLHFRSHDLHHLGNQGGSGHGKVEMGFTVQTISGVSIRGTAAYDGIGEKDFNDYQGRLLVTVPFKWLPLG
jgi:hypothetical protein